MYDYELPVTTKELYAANQRNNLEARELEAAGDPDGAEICAHAARAFFYEFTSKTIRALPPFRVTDERDQDTPRSGGCMIEIQEIDLTIHRGEFDPLPARLWLDDHDGAGRVVLIVDDLVWFAAWTRKMRCDEDLLFWLRLYNLEYIAKRMKAIEPDWEARSKACRDLVKKWRRQGLLEEREARLLWNDANFDSEVDMTDWFARAAADVDDPWQDMPGDTCPNRWFKMAWERLPAAK